MKSINDGEFYKEHEEEVSCSQKRKQNNNKKILQFRIPSLNHLMKS